MNKILTIKKRGTQPEVSSASGFTFGPSQGDLTTMNCSQQSERNSDARLAAILRDDQDPDKIFSR